MRFYLSGELDLATGVFDHLDSRLGRMARPLSFYSDFKPYSIDKAPVLNFDALSPLGLVTQELR